MGIERLNNMRGTIIITMLIATILFVAGCGESNMKTAIIKTNMGTIELELFTDTMPITTKNFIDLAEKEFYDGTRFHRIIGPAKMPPKGFMIQGGDPLTKDLSKQQFWGTGDPGYKIKDEFTENNRNDPGTISMANAGPNTGGSQFFINLGDNNFLDDKHPVFGKVTKGMDVVEAMGNVATEGQDRPVKEVLIEKVTIS